MHRFRIAFPIGVALVAVVAMSLTFAHDVTRDEGGTTSSAATLPTACENFAQASALFARGGSAEALSMTGDRVFTSNTVADSKQILDELMASCDAARGAH
jgi:hypothetical protein